jgi:hypothetical protein
LGCPAMLSSEVVPDIARARSLFQATRSLMFAEIPAIDLKDRISAFTVAAGTRPVGVLETWGQWLPQLRDAMIANSLFTSTARSVWNTIERPLDHPYRSILLALDEERVAGKPKHVLWLYGSKQLRDDHRHATMSQQQAGQTLGYPQCCIEFESSIMARLPEAQLQVLIAEAGADETNLLAAFKRRRQIAVGKLPPLPDNALRTEQQYPFALHVACNDCLNKSGSPTALLDARNNELVKDMDAGLHDLALRIQELYRGISKGKVNQVVFSQMRALHAQFLPIRRL